MYVFFSRGGHIPKGLNHRDSNQYWWAGGGGGREEPEILIHQGLDNGIRSSPKSEVVYS